MAENTTSGEQPTIIVNDTGRSSGGSGWLIGIVLLIALIAGIFLFTQNSGSEAAKDNAIGNAAGQVGDAAQKVGNAAQDAANNLKKQ